MIRNGKYSPETKTALKKSAEWLREKSKSKMITIIPLKQFSATKAIKVIKKYASLGVKYFVLDTFKNDIDIKNEKRWENLKQNAVKLYDCIKPEGKNVHLFLTMQVSLSDKRQRYLDLDSIAESKGAIEPMSSVLMMRWLFPDEYPNQKQAIEVRNLVGGIDTLVSLNPDKRYVVIFLAKLREGESGNRQVVCEMDLSKNTLKETGWTRIPFTSY
jgi:replicative DNA helicase